jgi:hypothetical protein
MSSIESPPPPDGGTAKESRTPLASLVLEFRGTIPLDDRHMTPSAARQLGAVVGQSGTTPGGPLGRDVAASSRSAAGRRPQAFSPFDGLPFHWIA